MPRIFAIFSGLAAALILTLGALSSPVGASSTGQYSAPPTQPIGNPHFPFSGHASFVCSTPSAKQAACGVQVLEPNTQPSTVLPAVVTSPSGLSPSAIESVYGFPSTGGSGTIAIVDAYDDPTASSDLIHFSQQYGLPIPNFTKIGITPQGTASTVQFPPPNASWDLEISLDIEWAHAIAPNAPILLVEAFSSGLQDLLNAESYAGAHAQYVSNSWGAGEFGGENSEDSYFSDPGVSYFAAAGDNGAGVEYPAASPDVTAVGGTSLKFTNSNVLASETAWSGSGGGCSTQERAAAAQAAYSSYSQTHCGTMRAVPDVALDADPNSGVAVYDTNSYEGTTGWWTVGGTSVATPIWAAESSVRGLTTSPSLLYGSTISFRDVLSGSNGNSAQAGLDLVTGRGSWANTPGTPTGLSAAASGSSISLSWTAPSGGSATVNGYNIWRGTASGFETELAQGVSGTSFVDSTVLAGTKYYYEAQPVDSVGTGPYSNEASATAASSGGTGTGGTGTGGTGTGGTGTGGTGTGGTGSGGASPPANNGTLTAGIQVSCPFGPTCTFTSTSRDSAGTITKYVWSGPGGLTGSTSTVSHTYTAAGSFSVQLAVTDNRGVSASASTSIMCLAFFGSTVCLP